MRARSIACRAIATCTVLAAAFAAAPATALQLITDSEAALPPAPNAGHERGISRGPTIVVVSPQPYAGTIKSPLTFKVLFEGHGGTAINVNSVLLTYLKKPTIDLTQRLEPYITPGGIDVEDAEVPPGTHTIRINVTDTDGRPGSTDITFSVSK